MISSSKLAEKKMRPLIWQKKTKGEPTRICRTPHCDGTLTRNPRSGGLSHFRQEEAPRYWWNVCRGGKGRGESTLARIWGRWSSFCAPLLHPRSWQKPLDKIRSRTSMVPATPARERS